MTQHAAFNGDIAYCCSELLMAIIPVVVAAVAAYYTTRGTVALNGRLFFVCVTFVQKPKTPGAPRAKICEQKLQPIEYISSNNL
jgi:hypothetical protein